MQRRRSEQRAASTIISTHTQPLTMTVRYPRIRNGPLKIMLRYLRIGPMILQLLRAGMTSLHFSATVTKQGMVTPRGSRKVLPAGRCSIPTTQDQTKWISNAHRHQSGRAQGFDPEAKTGCILCRSQSQPTPCRMSGTQTSSTYMFCP